MHCVWVCVCLLHCVRAALCAVLQCVPVCARVHRLGDLLGAERCLQCPPTHTLTPPPTSHTHPPPSPLTSHAPPAPAVLCAHPPLLAQHLLPGCLPPPLPPLCRHLRLPPPQRLGGALHLGSGVCLLHLLWWVGGGVAVCVCVCVCVEVGGRRARAGGLGERHPPTHTHPRPHNTHPPIPPPHPTHLTPPVWSALNSEPLGAECAGASAGQNKAIQIVGFVLALVLMAFTTMSGGTASNAFELGGGGSAGGGGGGDDEMLKCERGGWGVWGAGGGSARQVGGSGGLVLPGSGVRAWPTPLQAAHAPAASCPRPPPPPPPLFVGAAQTAPTFSMPCSCWLPATWCAACWGGGGGWAGGACLLAACLLHCAQRAGVAGEGGRVVHACMRACVLHACMNAGVSALGGAPVRAAARRTHTPPTHPHPPPHAGHDLHWVGPGRPAGRLHRGPRVGVHMG